MIHLMELQEQGWAYIKPEWSEGIIMKGSDLLLRCLETEGVQ